MPGRYGLALAGHMDRDPLHGSVLDEVTSSMERSPTPMTAAERGEPDDHASWAADTVAGERTSAHSC